ncbi:hypothetical protein [Edaphobacter modestus]|uniref:hypothetical protein n=1 Tax=Edaphobacter modestus TaxID=388466 RepID=UPI001A9273F6|nr:hypothetical protein [Edaphobacter modestus]
MYPKIKYLILRSVFLTDHGLSHHRPGLNFWRFMAGLGSRFSAIFTVFRITGILKGFGTTGVFLFIAASMLLVMAGIGFMGPPTRDLALEKISHLSGGEPDRKNWESSSGPPPEKSCQGQNLIKPCKHYGYICRFDKSRLLNLIQGIENSRGNLSNITFRNRN